ncbi:hypothetical protein Dimus_009604 [Dionaea muscipula]
MAMAATSLSYPPLLPSYPHPYPLPKISLRNHLPLGSTNKHKTLRLLSSPPRLQSHGLGSFSYGFNFSWKNLRVFFKEENQEGDGEDEAKVEDDWRGESTLPERFKDLTKPIPDPPLRWPWFLVGGLAVLVYGSTWRAVLWELGNWRNTLKVIIHFTGRLLNFFLSLIYYYLGDAIDTAVYVIRSLYSGIVSSAPVPELTTIILLASAVLSVAESTVPDSVNCQPHLLTFSGIYGYAAVRGYISEPLFWALLLGTFLFSRFVKKRDYVTSALPVAAVLASVGEPWVRAMALISFTALAIAHHAKHPAQGPEGEETTERKVTARKLPLPLVGVALAIGMRVAAQWAGHRHLTWMIV